jgi:hypothetical protein
MANLNAEAPVVRIVDLDGLTVCMTNDGTVIVPVQWDYVAWTPTTEQFIGELKSRKFPDPVTAYTILLTGVVSPMTAEALDELQVNVVPKALPGPLN